LTDSGDQLNPERLKYITENFTRLQGLSSISSGVLVIASRVMVAFDNPWVFVPGLAGGIAFWIIMMAAGGALVILEGVYIPRYYARRFGFVQPRPVTTRPLSSRQVVFYIVIVIVFGLLLMEMQHAIRPRVDLLALIVAIVMSFAAVGRARGPQRSTALITVAVTLNFVLAVIAVLPLWLPLGSGQILIWKLINVASPGIPIIFLGITDHLALTRLLPAKTDDDDHE
jgi:hypothetical protein